MNSYRRNSTIVGIDLAVVVFVLGLLLAPAAVLAQTGWQPQTLPGLEPGATFRLSDIKALSASEAWISGDVTNNFVTDGAILKTLDGGTWNLMFRKGELNEPNPWQRFWSFSSLSVVDSSTAWAVGSYGLTVFTTNGGSTWSHGGSSCGSGPGGTVIHNADVKAVNAGNMWVVGLLSPEGIGQIWHRPYFGDCAVSGFWPYRLEAQYNYRVVFAIDAADAFNAWAVGDPGIMHTTNEGNSWAIEVASPGGQLLDVAAVSPTVAWAVGTGGLILKTVDSGANWVRQGSGVAENLAKISAVSADVAWVVGTNGTILKTINGGATWRSQVSGPSDGSPAINFVGVAAVDANTAWAVGDQAVVLHVTDGGVYKPLSAPRVDVMNPAGGPIAGGTANIFVYGQDFRPGARVWLGGVAATSVEFRSSQELMITTPAHAAGLVSITVINPDGQSATLANAFAYADTQPLLVYVSPSYGYVDTQVELAIFGAGFTPNELALDPLPTVNINGAPVAVRWGTYSRLELVVPRGVLMTAGMANITVTTAAGTSNAVQFAVNYGWVYVERTYPPAPAIKSVTIPLLTGSAQATFYGLNGNGSIRVGKIFEHPGRLGGNGSPPTGYALLPSYYYEVTTYSALYYLSATLCFPYADADVTAAGLDESKLRLMRAVENDYSWADVTFTLDTTKNEICGTSGGLATYFAIAQGPVPVPPPVMTKIEPAIGPPAGGTTVTITGTMFQLGATVTIGGVAATNVTVQSSMTLTAMIPAHVLGFVDVVVTNPDAQKSTLTGGFEYVGPPTVTSITPDRGRYYTAITITGTGFRGGNGGSIKIGGTQLSGYSMVDDTTITGYAPSHALGTVDVVVTNPDGQSGTLVNGFTYMPAPTVTNVAPNAGPLKGGTPVTITGTGFQTGATVMFSGTMATDVVVVNSTTVTAVTPARAAGAVWVRVTNPDGQYGTRNLGFTYMPAIMGDVNADGVVNVLDAIMVLQVLSARNPVPAGDIGADVNNDGAIGMAEAIFILQKAAEIR